MREHDPSGRRTVNTQEPAGSIDTALSRPHPGTAVLTVQGEVDMLTAPRFESAVAELIACPDSVRVIDLSGVSFLASSGLAVLIRAAHRTEENGVRLRLVASTRSVRRPLEVTGADQLFEIHPDADAAVTARD